MTTNTKAKKNLLFSTATQRAHRHIRLGVTAQIYTHEIVQTNKTKKMEREVHRTQAEEKKTAATHNRPTIAITNSPLLSLPNANH
jgi:hypothetical protein